ncbi:MAG: glycosyltransferase [Desulfuromonadaceae bacterium]|nr:glycosyltransferase [Desulfuromonadaceae bacterium]
MDQTSSPWIFQLCHGYTGPFLDCARQYAVLFKDSPYKVCTVYLTGAPDEDVRLASASDDVVFLDYSSRQIRGLKLGAIRQFRELVARNGHVQFVIAHRFKPIYIALLSSKLPVIGVHHAFGVYQRRTRQWFINRFKQRLTLLAVSNAVRDEIRRHLNSWPAQRIETLYNRIDVAAVRAEQCPRAEARQQLGLPQQTWIVGNVGRLHPDKDQATLIRGFAKALPHLPADSLLAIMGSGKLEPALKKLANELGITDKVRFLGQVPQGRRYFRAFDLFALTSDHEPFGMVLLEAMAAGLPLICSDCGGGREVVQQCGRLFPLGDSDALARELVTMNRTPGEDAQKIEQELTEKFSDDAVKKVFWRDILKGEMAEIL